MLIGLVLFGSKKLPEVGRSLGKAINEFKKGLQGEEEKNPGEKPADGNNKLEPK